MLGEPHFQEVSEIPLFNLIGEYGESKGYDVVYFKSVVPKNSKEHKYMNYIHLYKDEELNISIYFNTFDIEIFEVNSYYELYRSDTAETERFFATIEEERRLFDTVKKLIKQ